MQVFANHYKEGEIIEQANIDHASFDPEWRCYKQVINGQFEVIEVMGTQNTSQIGMTVVGHRSPTINGDSFDLISHGVPEDYGH